MHRMQRVIGDTLETAAGRVLERVKGANDDKYDLYVLDFGVGRNRRMATITKRAVKRCLWYPDPLRHLIEDVRQLVR